MFLTLGLFPTAQAQVAADEIQLLCQVETIYSRSNNTHYLGLENCSVTFLGSDHFGKIKEEKLASIRLELHSASATLFKQAQTLRHTRDYITVTLATHIYNHAYTGKTKMLKVNSLNLGIKEQDVKGMLVAPAPYSVPCSASSESMPNRYFDC